ncbi:MAG: hypothetical protein A3C61_01705 [Candidatus Yanofskybacteria bacterium RIFCSPHIGHO2_02_FULL_39_10]|uniref:Prepilin-type N-terminal cleavage/methylation domain-containing protein n=1 Tax=Candidatus Yanofskybacteria bacterium RIFCSPHIGHO2_02_FULL_39_10 TaxID=1802674 RepID=A0A1F8FA56_9BACT|nr:MAG: hypothetical protein A3C61_01705 [Candidatus Yanofskybacteria bacterium RIFCSPHIGHO2_02_FULL_39_10]
MKIKNLKFVTPAKRSSNPMEQWSHDCRRMTKTRNCSAGFTLIEMVITILVFSILVVTIVGIFIQAVRIERRAVLAQQIQENAMYVLESMAKEIRVSEIVDQDSPNCVATDITLDHPINGTIIYGLSSDGLGNIERQDGSMTVLNSSVTQFTRFNFCVTGSGTSDNKSAKVTILMSLKNRAGPEQLSVNLQTTVVSRDITTEFQNP